MIGTRFVNNWSYTYCPSAVGHPQKLVVLKMQQDSTEFSQRVQVITDNPQWRHWATRLVWDINRVRATQLTNRYGLRISLNTTWNIPLLRSLLVNYHDKQVVEWLQFGWPIGYHPGCPPPEWALDNHKSANDFAGEVDNYILKELKYFSLLGPFVEPPFGEPIGCCALSTRSKRDSTDRRILMDYSWPLNKGINTYISKDYYLGQEVFLKYPRIDDLCERVASLGPRALLFKKDIRRAFKTIGIDLRDVPLQGFRWRNYWWFDLTNVMGSRLGPYIMQRVSSAIVFIHTRLGYFLLCYADDFAGAELPHLAWKSYNTLGQLLRDLGVSEALDKAVSPASEIVFLGTGINAAKQVIFVIPERMEEILRELEYWRWAAECTRRQLESLIGKLQFCANCVRPGRLFISRMLNALKCMVGSKIYSIPTELKMDVRWWWNFLPHFRSEYLLWPQVFEEPDAVLASDASLRAAGAVCGKQYFHVEFPEWVKRDTHIGNLELIAVILACKRWTVVLQNKRVVINCDNLSVVYAINSGRTKDLKMQMGLRELVFLCCCNGIELRARHIFSVENRLPDYLSRWNMGAKYRRAFFQLTRGKGFRRVMIPENMFKFTNQW